MGGHGGLNILPQKRWHLYRDDNRERVRRDEEEHRQQQEEAERAAHSAALDASMDWLRRRRRQAEEEDEEEEEEEGEELRDEEQRAEIGRSSEGAQDGKRVKGRSDRKRSEKRDEFKTQASGMKKGSELDNANAGHINLFAEEERAATKQRLAHEKYLKEVGHDAKAVPDFDAYSVSKKGVPWYMQSQLPSTAVYEAHRLEKAKSSAPADAGDVVKEKKQRKKDESERWLELEERRKFKRKSGKRERKLSFDSSGSSCSSRKQRKRHCQRRSRQESSDSKRRTTGKKKNRDSDFTIEELRQKRIKREADERKHTLQVLQNVRVH